MSRFLLLAGLLCIGPMATAQMTTGTNAVVTPPQQSTTGNLSEDDAVSSIARRLTEHDPAIRSEALREVSYLSEFSPELEGLSDLAPSLLGIMRDDTNAMHRIMAAQSLTRLGDAATLRTVSRISAADPNPQVRRTVQLALKATSREYRR